MNIILQRLSAAFDVARNWAQSLRQILFEFGFSSSYGRDAAKSEYASVLQRAFGERDFCVFRNQSHLTVGDNLTIRSQWSLWRTRCLLALGLKKALKSKLVAKEIAIFAKHGRRVRPIELESIREMHPWRLFADTLFVDERLPTTWTPHRIPNRQKSSNSGMTLTRPGASKNDLFIITSYHNHLPQLEIAL